MVKYAPEYTCQHCGAYFAPINHKSKFCSPSCSDTHRNIELNNAWANRKPVDPVLRAKINRKRAARMEWVATEPRNVVSKRLKVMRG